MNQKNSFVAPRFWLASVGTTVSIACAIQCTFFPLLIGILPLLGLSFLVGDDIEKVFLVTFITLALASFYFGARYHKTSLHLFVSRRWHGVDRHGSRLDRCKFRDSICGVGNVAPCCGPPFKSTPLSALRYVRGAPREKI
jgi:hypothetical protein